MKDIRGGVLSQFDHGGVADCGRPDVEEFLSEREELIPLRDALMVDRAELIRARDALMVERDALLRQRCELIHERDGLMQERDGLMQERDALMRGRDAMMAERDTLMGERDALLARLSEGIEAALPAPPPVDWVRLSGPSRELTVGVNVVGAHGGQVTAMVASLGRRGVTGSAVPIGDVPEALLIGGSTGPDGHFDASGGRVRHHQPSSGSFGFHPAVLADVLETDLSSHFVACGYPGSGNGVIQASLEAFVRARPPAIASADHLLSAFVADYRARIDAALQPFDGVLGDGGHDMATFRDGKCSARWMAARHRAVLFGLPLRNHLTEPVHKTHEPFGPHLARLGCQGARLVLVLRHPLDTIVSIAKKASAVVDVLRAEWLLREIARGIVAYYDSFSAPIAEGTVITVRYEDCARDFPRTLQDLALACNVALGADDASRLAQSLWNRPVSGPGHLWLPGAGKWKDYLDRRSLSVLLEEGVGRTMASLAYESPEPLALPERPHLSMPVLPSLPPESGLAFFSHCCRSLDHAVEAYALGGVRTSTLKWEGLDFFATSDLVFRAFPTLAAESALRGVLDAGRGLCP